MSPSFAAIVSVLLPLISMVSGHMVMSNPPPFRYKGNPNTPSAEVDYSYTSPLDSSGSNFPCKGYNKDFNSAGGASVATWAAGSTQTLTLTGSAVHGGGSCQVSFSPDGGKTFKVARSYEGNCPHSDLSKDTTLSFTVPSSAPNGKLIVAWTWFNKLGNREMYMNCAAVTITGGGSGFSSALPDMFVANVGNGCTTVDSQDVKFPNPGSDLVTDSSGAPVAPSGSSCGTSSNSSSGTNTSPIASLAATPTSSPKASSSAIKYQSGYAPSPAAASTSSVPESVPSGDPTVPACKRSVRYSIRNVQAEPIMIQPGCQCTCVNNIPQPINCGSL